MGGLSILSRIVQWKEFFVVSIINDSEEYISSLTYNCHEYLSFSQVCDVAVLISAAQIEQDGPAFPG